MDAMHKWLTTGVFLFVFMGLVALSGCLHVAEFFGSAFVGIVVARMFFFGIRKNHSETWTA